MNVDLIIFDLDGTLVNSIPDLTDSVNVVAKFYNKKIFDEKEVSKIVGSGLVKLIEDVFNINHHESDFNNYYDKFIMHYEANFSNRSYVYKNVIDTLNHFNTKKLAILSNKVDHITKQVALDYNIAQYFNIVQGATADMLKKPSGDPILHILNVLKVQPSKAVMVGDSEQDIMSANNAGIKSIALTGGYRSLNQLKKHNPDFVIDDIKELKSIITINC